MNNPEVMRSGSRRTAAAAGMLSLTIGPDTGIMASPTRALLASLLLPVSLLSAPAVDAKPSGGRLALTLAAAAPAACVDVWGRPQSCRADTAMFRARAHPTPVSDRWWSGLWSAAGEAVTSPQFVLGGKRVACGPAYDAGSLFKLDFTGFQLNMDVDLDDEQEHFDTVRLAYRSCWR